MLTGRRFPSLPSIRAFEAAARLGGFARAADELDTTAASVSYHVRRLEEQLGVRLFVRHAQRVELTDAGRDEATVARCAARPFLRNSRLREALGVRFDYGFTSATSALAAPRGLKACSCTWPR